MRSRLRNVIIYELFYLEICGGFFDRSVEQYEEFHESLLDFFIEEP